MFEYKAVHDHDPRRHDATLEKMPKEGWTLHSAYHNQGAAGYGRHVTIWQREVPGTADQVDLVGNAGGR